MKFIKKIELLLKKTLSLQKIYVTGDNNHIKIIAISDTFTNMNEINRQKIIYKPLISFIENKTIHAISIKTYSTIEWENNKLNSE